MDWTARFTGLLVLITFLLVVVTGGLVWVARRQLQDARALQRAYVSAMPGGVSTTTRGELLAHVEFKNVGHSPASQVKSLLKFTADDTWGAGLRTRPREGWFLFSWTDRGTIL